MKAFARLFSSLITTMPVVHWVVIGSLAVWLVSLAAAYVVDERSIVRFGSMLPAMVACAFLLVCATCTTGFMLRTFAAPRTHRLIPFFRAKLLGAVLLALVLSALPWVAVMHWMSALDPRAARLGPSAGVAFVYPFAFSSVATWAVFFAAARQSRMFGVWLAFVAAAALFDRGRALGISLESLMDSTAAVAATALGIAAGWAAFAIWFLRTPRVLPVMRFGQPDGSFDRLDSARLRFGNIGTLRNAVRIHLTGRIDQRMADRLLSFLLVFAFATVLSFILQGSGKTDAVGLLVATIAPAAASVVISMNVARGARRLWLRHGGTRAELFAVCEREALENVLVVLVLIMIIGVVLSTEDGQWARLAHALVLAATTGALGGYLGLMRIEPLGWRDVLAWVWLAVSTAAVVLVVLWASPQLVPVAVLLAAAQLAGALACRSRARRLWLTIDWRALKPLRFSPQALRR